MVCSYYFINSWFIIWHYNYGFFYSVLAVENTLSFVKYYEKLMPKDIKVIYSEILLIV